MKRIITLLFIAFAGAGFAQSVFVKTIENPDSSAISHSIIQTSDGGYFIAGSLIPKYKSKQKGYIVKLNNQGDTVWTHLYGDTSNTELYSIRSVSNGYIAAGYSRSFTSKDSAQAYLLKIDLSGNMVFQKTYGRNTADSRAFSVKPTTDGGYILAGRTNAIGNAIGYSNIYIIKTNANGDTTWTKKFGDLYADEAFAIETTTDGGYIVTGYTRIIPNADNDLYVIKLSSAGATQWTKTYGGKQNDAGYAIKQTTDGGYIIAGSTYSFNSQQMGYLVKTNSIGDTLWTQHVIGGTDPAYVGARFNDVIQKTDGGYITVGNRDSLGTPDYTLSTFDKDGILLSVVKAKTNLNNRKVSDGTAIQATTDGGFVATGFINDITINKFTPVIIKYTKIGDTCDVHVKATTSAAIICKNQLATLTANITGNNPPYAIQWSDGNSGKYDFAKTTGTYRVTVSDNKSCTAIDSVKVLQELPNATFATDVISGKNPLTVNFINKSTGALTYKWLFADGSPINTAINPTHVFQNVNNYPVKLIAKAQKCSDTSAIQTIIVTGNISGTVRERNNIAVSNGNIYLLHKGGKALYDTLQTALLQPSGEYLFTDVVKGEYILSTTADTLFYKKHLSTYFGDTLYWGDASVINMNADKINQNIFIRNKPGTGVGNGIGTINGVLLQSDTALKKQTSQVGTPITYKQLYLRDVSNFSFIQSTMSNGSGAFSFKKVPSGNYMVVVDYPGIADDRQNFAKITTTKNLWVGTVQVDTVKTLVTLKGSLGTENIATMGISAQLYPNPLSDGQLNIAMQTPTATSVVINVYDLPGKLVNSQVYTATAGTQTIPVDFYNQNNGVYLVDIAFTINNNTQHIRQKVVVNK
jgi:PKD repeat protein